MSIFFNICIVQGIIGKTKEIRAILHTPARMRPFFFKKNACQQILLISLLEQKSKCKPLVLI